MAAADFDFARYLRKIVPDVSYTIAKLSGGVCNVTVRAIPLPRPAVSDNLGPFGIPKNSSIVLKYAPPFVAGMGPSVPLSQHRQKVEAAALTYLQQISHITGADSAVVTPKLLHEDHENHVLILEDLGSDTAPINKWLENGPPISTVCSVGDRVGRFLAALHSQRLDAKPAITALLEIESAQVDPSSVDSELTNKFLAHLASAGYGETDVAALRSLTRTEAEDRSINDTFSHGDLWSESILVNKDASVVGIIDWEFVGLAKPLLDMSTLRHVYSRCVLGPSPGLQQAGRALIRCITTSYRDIIVARGVRWTRDPTLRAAARHAAYVIVGHEIITRTEFWNEECRKRVIDSGVQYFGKATRIRDGAGDDGLELVDDVLGWTTLEGI
ncbi:hypothetical protein BOTBODRAFT_174900 [Botryobasidium botryosum FD-172 SS1]|uniref:Aminoglycoside phosphotransferase domain-containing protein n=1 Tax=Botryobasidium botryosum (strain FD-172 SS1) TaxID=930990 RepID=A0A067MQB8_BOTB1|nr:hypothetical protein BOTBODRAFT_174900 [Botryobasidium botryosum FD-172 SS1]